MNKRLGRVEDLEELLAGSDGDRLLDGTLGLALGAEELLATESLGVRVEAEENGLVAEGVLLLGEGPLLGGLASGAEDGLDLVRVDDAGNVRVGDLGNGETSPVSADLLSINKAHSRVTGLGGVDVVKLGDGRLSPDDEAADVTTGGELKQVQGVDTAGLNTGKVLERTDEAIVLAVDDKGTTALAVAPVPHLTLTGTDLARVGNLLDIGVGADGLEEVNRGLGLGDRLGGGGDNEGNLLNLLDAVTAGEDQRRNGGGSQSRGNSEALLVLVDLDVPLAPDLEGREHARTTLTGALVTIQKHRGDRRIELRKYESIFPNIRACLSQGVS